jgi:hypothetical protein
VSAPVRDAAEAALLQALRGLRYGSVEAVVHDGRIARIERREKWRLEPDPTAEGAEGLDIESTRRRPERRSDPNDPTRGES